MSETVLTVKQLSNEEIYSQTRFLNQARSLMAQEAGKAIVAVGSRWVKTKRNQEPGVVKELPAYDLNTYEQMYVHVDLLHRAVNKIAETITENFIGFGSPVHLLEEEEVAAQVQSGLKTSLQQTRRWARWIAFASHLEELLKPALWSGNGYWEVVYDEQSEWKVTVLKELNPKEMRVVRDETGEVLGYVQFPFKTGLSVLSPELKNRYVRDGAIYLDKEKVIHVKWNPLPSEAYGQSLFECIKDIMAIIIGLREDMGIIGKNNATPSTHYRLGTDIIPAAPKSITDFTTLVEGMDHTKDLVTSTFIDSKPIRDPSKILDMPKYLRAALNILYASLGLPEILFGQGNETTEATAKVQIEAAAQMFRSIQRKLKDQIELHILPRLILGKEYENLMPNDMDIIPEMVFEPIETEEDKRLRLENGVKIGSLSHQDYRRAYKMRPQIEGEVVIEQDREFQLDLAKASTPIMSPGGGQGNSGGPSKQKPKDRSAASSAKKGKVKK